LNYDSKLIINDIFFEIDCKGYRPREEINYRENTNIWILLDTLTNMVEGERITIFQGSIASILVQSHTSLSDTKLKDFKVREVIYI
jgi:hypothetical protein